MAKHVFSTRELAHVFFHQDEFGITDGRNTGNGNFSFDCNTIYSYNSQLGIADFDKKIFLFRSGSYSSTTTKHQSYTRRAVPDGWKVYSWNNWRSFPYKNEYIDERILSCKNDKYALKHGTKYFGKPNLIESIRDNIVSFCNDLECVNLLQSAHDELDKLQWTDEELKIYEVKTWCVANGITGSYDTKVKVFNNPELSEGIIAKNLARKRHLEDTKEERRLKAIQSSINKWYNNEVRDISFQNGRNSWRYNNPVYLRIKANDDKMVETSKGANVPLIECALLYRKFKQCVETNTEWYQNGEKFRIGYYHVDSIKKINDEWRLICGCHTLFDTQINEFVNRFTEWNKV